MITIQVESLTDRLEEMKPLFPLHYEELALDKDGCPLNPNYEIYLQRDQHGEVLFLAMRDAGELIGYFVGFIAPGLHYRSTLTCTMDIFFVHPERRNGSAGLKLFKAVEEECRRRGVKRIFVGSKCHADASALFERRGFTRVEVYYSKWLG